MKIFKKIKNLIEKIVTKYIDNNFDKIGDHIAKKVMKDMSAQKEAEPKIIKSLEFESVDYASKEEISFNVEYYSKVDKRKRYFAQRISDGEINNNAPEWAKYVVSIHIKQPHGKRFKIDYSDVDKPVPERGRIEQDVSGFSMKRNSSNAVHIINFKRFFDEDVGKDFAVKAILQRILVENRE